MDRQLLILVLSIAGAVLFFASGYTLSIWRKRNFLNPNDEEDLRLRLAALDKKNVQLAAKIKKSKQQVVDKEAKNAQLAANVANLTQTLLEKQKQETQLKSQLEQVGNKLNAQKTKENTAQKKLGENAKQLSKQLFESEQKRKKIESESAKLSRQFNESKKKLTAFESIQKDNTKLRDQIDTLKKNLADKQNELSSTPKSDSSNLELEEYKRKITKFQSVQEENAELKLRIQAAAHKASQSEALEKQVKELRSKLFIKDEDTSAEPVKVKRTESSTLQGDMEETLAELVEMDQVRSAIVADAQGLLVGGSGQNEYFEGLAAIAGRIEEVSQRIGDVLPFSDLRVVQLKDKNDAIVACRFFVRDEELLVLATLGSNTPPGEGALEMTVANLTIEEN